MYHQINSEPRSYFPIHATAPDTFANQMKLLKRLGYQTINMDQLYEYWKGNLELPSKPIIITFDDGLVEAINHSSKILKKYGFTAVYYIPSDFIGKTSDWLLDELGFKLPIIDWEKVKWLDSNSFQVACHSKSHPHLNAITTDQCVEELRDSKKKLEDFLGHDVNHLAYPYGSYNEKVINIAEDLGFHTACTTEEGFCTLDNNSLALPRINIEAKDSLLDFMMKLYTGKAIYPYFSSKVPKRIKQFVKSVFKLN